MAMRGTAAPVAAPGTQDATTRGSQAVSSVPMFLLLQHQMIDQAENDVLAYRRLVSHVEFEGALTHRNLKKNRGKYGEEIPKADDLMLRFRNRVSPYGCTVEFKPLDYGDMYKIRVIFASPFEPPGPWMTVHGPDLPAAKDTLMIPAREREFERATLPISAMHSQLHDWLDLLGLMTFESAYSNMAVSMDERIRQKQVGHTDELLERRRQAQGLAELVELPEPAKARRPSGPNGGDGVPDWADEGV